MFKFMLYNNLKSIKSLDVFVMGILAVISALLMTFVGYKIFQMLQQSGYRLKRYFSWFKETRFSYFSRLFMLSFLSLAAVLLSSVLLNEFFIVESFNYFPLLFFILFSCFFITILFSEKQKTPLKYTKRIKRLICVNFILSLLVSFGLEFIGFCFIPYLSIGLICLLPVILPIVILISFIITLPIEKLIANSYVKKAKNKINSIANLTTIGITGSYGKTTLKNILNAILSEKYKVCATPENYNTPMGLSKTILNNLKEDDEIFIAELGARQQGDIMQLCEMVSPKIGIITGIGNQHLSSFGSIETIIKTKGELAEYITKNGNDLFINIESKNSKLLSENYKNSYLLSILNQNNVKFENVEVTTSGLKFIIKHGEDEKIIESSLIGAHNVSNLYIAVNVAINLGLTLSEIKNGVENLKSVPHRLEVINGSNGMTIIDDSYNCSVEGVKASLNVISKFSGKKFIITPGIVELGKEQYNENFEFGKNLASVCDYVIIDSMINFKAITEGLVSVGYDTSKIMIANSLTDAVEKLNKHASHGDVVLFENDLPDNFN